MLRDARLIAAKDLRIERSSRVLLGQVLPFGLIVLILFGFGISPDRRVVEAPDRSVLEQVAPGLFWIAVLLSALLALSRAFAVESVDGTLDGLRLTGLDPGGIFLGKAAAVAVELAVIEVLLGAGALLFYGAPVTHPALLAVVMISTTAAIAAAGTLQAALAGGPGASEALGPILILPTLAPVLLGATLSTEAALFGPASDGWPWAAVVAAFAVLYAGVGTLSFGLLLEDS